MHMPLPLRKISSLIEFILSIFSIVQYYITFWLKNVFYIANGLIKMYNIDKKEIIRTFKLFYMGGSSMKKIRNILSIALVFVMLIGFAPANVFADEANPSGSSTKVTQPGSDNNDQKADVDTRTGETEQGGNKSEQGDHTTTSETGKKEDPLKKEKDAAIAALDELKFLSPQEIADAKNAITDASNEEGINKALEDAKKQNAANELAKAKEDAKKKVDEDNTIKDKEKAKNAIDKAESTEDVKKALEEAKKPAEDKKEDNNTNPPAPAAKTYTIYPKTVGNGTVSTVSESEAGKTITVEATPAYGYVVDRIVVTNLETDRSVPVNYTHKSYFNDYPYYLRSRWYDDYPYDYDDYIRWCDRNGYSRYDSDNYRIWCRRYGYRYDYDDFRRWYDWDDVYGHRWYNRYDYSYYDKAQFTMPASHVKVTVTFTSAPYWYDGYYYDYETGTYRYYYDDDYYYYRNRKNKKSNYYERQAEKDKKEEEEAKAKAEAAKQPQIYENKAVISIGSNVLDKVSKNVHTVHEMDTPAYVNNGRVMLPLRYVAEALGLQVSWVPETKTVIIWDLTQRVEIPVKSNRIIVNGITYTSDVKPEIKSSRTMLPIANIARALGLIDGSDIIWDQYNKQVTLTRKVLSK